MVSTPPSLYPLTPSVDIIISIFFSFDAFISIKNTNLEVSILIICAVEKYYLYYSVLYVLHIYLQVLEKIDLEVWEFLIFSEFDILGWYLNRVIKHARITVIKYFIGIFIKFVVLSYKPNL